MSDNLERAKRMLEEADAKRVYRPADVQLAEAAKVLQARIDAGQIPRNIGRARLTLLRQGIGLDEQPPKEGFDFTGLDVETLDRICAESASIAIRLRAERGEDVSAYYKGESDESKSE